MGIISINEPLGPGRTTMLTPQSINEPVDLEMPDPPVITALVPDSCAIGDPDFTLDVEGTGFYPQSVIHFAGHDEPTTYNDGTLSTGVKPSLWTSPVVVQCQVRNGETMSNAVDFTFSDITATAEGADPDELEEQIDEAAEEGDFKPTHRGRPSKTLPKNRKK
jgi:hypothetical protein